MKIRNLTVKPIGFGSTIILPDETGTLPQGYDKNHPTVKYYLSRKWIEEIGGTDSGSGAPAAVNVGVEVSTGGADEERPGGTSSKPLDRMNKEELQALAFERGVEFAETDTRQTLIDKIRATQKNG